MPASRRLRTAVMYTATQTAPPIAPSQLLPGLIAGAILCLPSLAAEIRANVGNPDQTHHGEQRQGIIGMRAQGYEREPKRHEQKPADGINLPTAVELHLNLNHKGITASQNAKTTYQTKLGSIQPPA